MLADMHCHYPMHVVARKPRRPPREAPAVSAEDVAGSERPGWLEELRADVLSFAADQLNDDGDWRVSLDGLAAADVRGVFSVLYEPFSEFDLDELPDGDPETHYFPELLKQIDRVEQDLAEVDGDGRRHEVVRDRVALDRVSGEGKAAFMHCVEGGFHLGASVEEVTANVAELARRGVVYVTLAHLFWRGVATNAPAIPFLADDVYRTLFRHRGPALSPLGEAAVRAMYEHRILIDISHMDARARAATFDLLDQLDRKSGAAPEEHPVIATHAGFRFGEQDYMLDAEAVERIAARDGVIGLILARHQLNDGIELDDPDDPAATHAVIRRHVDAIRAHVPDHTNAHVAIGSDLDGFIKPTVAGVETAADLASLEAPLRDAYGGRRRRDPRRQRPPRRPQLLGRPMSGGGEGGGGEGGILKTAGLIVGLLAGIVAAIYLLGGLVLSLRLFYAHLHQDEVVSAVARLPREEVVAAGLLDVLGAAIIVGLLAAMAYGLADRPRPRGAYGELSKEAWLARSSGKRWLARALRRLSWWVMWVIRGLRPRGPRREPPLSPEQELDRDRLTAGHWCRALLLFAFFLLVAILGAVPALSNAIKADDTSRVIVPAVFAIILTYGVLAAGWHTIRRLARRPGWSRGGRALAAGGVWAVVAIVPVLMFAGTREFVPAQVCTTGATAPVRGKLIGESSDHLFLAEGFGEEAAVLELPSGQVTRSEYGDLASTFACPLSSGEKIQAKAAEASLEGHGSPSEIALATELRPRLLFDSRERWRPITVDAFLAERFEQGGHRLCRPGAGCEPTTGIAQLTPRGSPSEYIDIDGKLENGDDFEAADPGCRTQLPVVDCNVGPQAAIYYRRTTHEGRWYWDYWWFLRYNDYVGPLDECNAVNCSDHEGDWEGITVVTTPTEHPRILGALYAAHRNRILVEGGLLPLSGGRPLVFAAEGTHASYPYRCRVDCRQYQRLADTVRLPETPHDGAAPWGENDDARCERDTCVRPLPEVEPRDDLSLPLAGSWAGWPGLWGETCHTGCGFPLLQGSPRSPGLQIRFECPWAATDRALPAANGSGLSRSEKVGDGERVFATCRAQRGGERGLTELEPGA